MLLKIKKDFETSLIYVLPVKVIRSRLYTEEAALEAGVQLVMNNFSCVLPRPITADLNNLISDINLALLQHSKGATEIKAHYIILISYGPLENTVLHATIPVKIFDVSIHSEKPHELQKQFNQLLKEIINEFKEYKKKTGVFPPEQTIKLLETEALKIIESLKSHVAKKKKRKKEKRGVIEMSYKELDLSQYQEILAQITALEDLIVWLILDDPSDEETIQHVVNTLATRGHVVFIINTPEDLQNLIKHFPHAVIGYTSAKNLKQWKESLEQLTIEAHDILNYAKTVQLKHIT